MPRFRRRRRRSRLSLRSSSLERLQEALIKAKASELTAKTTLDSLQWESYRAVGKSGDAASTLQKLDAELDETRRLGANKPGFWQSLFGAPALTPQAQARVSDLLQKRREVAQVKEEQEQLTRRIEWAKEGIANANEWRQRLERAIETRLRKREKHDQLRAAAAANADESRRVAASIKRQIAMAAECPYCGDPLGRDPQCDHIYPVSKGGRSTKRNMVWVCLSCNKKKRDQTLAAFVKQHGLDRDAIEHRLATLGKEF